MPGSERVARVVKRTALTARVNELVLEVAGAPPFRWQAGQYLTLHPEGGVGAHEGPLAYSIASHCDGTEPPRLALAVGPGTGAVVLADVGPGALLPVDGPFGSFTLPVAAGALLVGAGTGVAPLRAHVWEWLARADAGPIVLLAGARMEGDLLWQRELVELALRFPQFHFEPVLSQPAPGWSGRVGRVHEHLPALVATMPRGFLTRVCGAKAMVDASLAALASLGIASDRIESESY